MRVLVAGATGAIGRPLVERLVQSGHHVIATTRAPDNAQSVRKLGATAMLMDGLDAASVGETVARAEPDAIIHQMTALAGKPDLRHFDRWFAKTNELRTTGTQHLLAAAAASGVSRFVAQSYTGWNNAREGGPVKTEDDPLDSSPAKAQRETQAALQVLESAVMEAPLVGIVLRYGNFYGPAVSDSLVELVRKRMMPILGDGAGVWSWIHIDDAAAATVAALERGERDIYNVTDDEPARVSEWLPYLADVIGAKRPFRLPAWLGRVVAGDVAVQWMTEGRGASNAKAKRSLGWRPTWPSWRDGFRDAFGDATRLANARRTAAHGATA